MAIALPVGETEGASESDRAGLVLPENRRLIENLYRSYRGELCAKLRHMFGSGPPDPEDAAQTAFARFAALDEPGRIANPRAFLFATARNVVLDHKRSLAVQFAYANSALSGAGQPVLDELTPERVYMERERFDIVRRTLETLPEKQRVVLNLHRNQGYTYQQIVRETGWSYGDVHRQMEAALAVLMDALKR